ncbi:RNA polymerase sigma factor [Paenibacillus larvae]|nr:RNA polymerase sigma factor [Paenibacillus larvae]AQR77772.1 RNA polymerase subunit sigma-70 [Paenibacillus larvae subsp. larvae]AQZ46178.1 RNA polymerase subunit sigma-70 [Paenibacillus larvae subsp. pulvifaciens]AVF21130.1 RNA polymerase sigma factor SigW-like protein [Paenibacillus larvae subsp. larvae]AVF27845.1 RNA polymerase sigma factor SigW-like protein [Paenibacillus larvae subsp. larvae]AVF32348.1 RNA polymerase sigma factor SigW-like protein [Paenibacillus larvae subsp. larvae]
MSKNLIQLFTADFLSMDKGMQEQIYKEFYMLVYPTIYFILRDHTLVEDLIQESFIRAIRKAPLLKEPEKYEGWLKKLTRNVTLNHLRKVKRNRDELDAEINLAPREYVNWVPDTNLEKEVELKMMQEAIIHYVNQLSPSYRQILAMKWIHHLSYKDMAEELGVTEGVVRQRLYRAREAIRQKLMEEWDIVEDRVRS